MKLALPCFIAGLFCLTAPDLTVNFFGVGLVILTAVLVNNQKGSQDVQTPPERPGAPRD